MKWAAALACALLVAAVLIRLRAERDDWVTEASAREFLLKLSADAPVRGWTRWSTPTLIVRCVPHQPALLLLVTGLPVEVERGLTRSVRIQFDDGPAYLANWFPSDDRQILSAPASDSAEMIERFGRARRLDIAFVPLQSDPVDAQFAVAGFDRHWAGGSSLCR